MKKRLKTNGSIIFFGVLLLVLFPKSFFRNDKPDSFYTVIEACGLTMILLGQLLRVSARGFKAEHSQEGGLLIKSGPYQLMRNPMYLGILLIGLGIVLVLFKWWVTGVFLLIFFFRYILLIYKEEEKLNTLFPDGFPAYKQQVPRLLPSLSVIFKTNITEYFPLKLSWLRKEIGSISTTLFVVLLLKSWEDIRNKGLKNYLKEAMVMLAVIIFFVLLIIHLSRQTNEQDEKCCK